MSEWISVGAPIAGIAFGLIVMVSVLYVFLARPPIGYGGLGIFVVGVILVVMSVWLLFEANGKQDRRLVAQAQSLTQNILATEKQANGAIQDASKLVAEIDAAKRAVKCSATTSQKHRRGRSWHLRGRSKHSAKLTLVSRARGLTAIDKVRSKLATVNRRLRGSLNEISSGAKQLQNVLEALGKES